ncbi:MAG: hns-dependent expression protein A (HdeA) [Saliniramus fredricksonii]|uniref:HdeA/HdeB family protein n=1 Tax=Saliniramus fredricksonii TaxID=1653334 RepID=A0A0P8AB27_9HYPH|nr:HdeA/HdeB family chaperone [Saliniramus fredricksonii]KPQ12416.1 MAG: hns-dependent expression protein A (HdeA) [Saliniramus fredricksonii]SCC81318.1 HdeA/HdeB family protein [Saliniramus fredricksonii]
MLRRTVFSVFCAVFVFLLLSEAPNGAALAQNRAIDMMRVDCAQFDRLRSARKRSIGVWLHGYYIGTGQRPLLDIDGIEGAVEALISFCAENPEAPLVSNETATILRGEEPPVAANGSGSGSDGMSGNRAREGLRITVPSDAPRDPPRDTQSVPAPSPEMPMRPRPVD